MPHAEVTLPGASSSVPTARRFVESILSSWGESELGWTATLLVSELAANCALHARTDFTVRVDADGPGRVRLEVSDGSVRLPQQRMFGVESTTGRGLRIVADLAAEWGVDTRPDGKTVWVLLEDRPAVSGDDDDRDADVDLDALLASFGGEDGDPAHRSPGSQAVRTLLRARGVRSAA